MEKRIKITISVSLEMQKSVRAAIRKYEFPTTSEFFRLLLRDWMKKEADLDQKRKDILHEHLRHRTEALYNAIAASAQAQSSNRFESEKEDEATWLSE